MAPGTLNVPSSTIDTSDLGNIGVESTSTDSPELIPPGALNLPSGNRFILYDQRHNTRDLINREERYREERRAELRMEEKEQRRWEREERRREREKNRPERERTYIEAGSRLLDGLFN